MTVIRFLADFAQLLFDRASKEGIQGLTAVYGQTQDTGCAYVDITGPQGGSVTIGVEHPLDGLLADSYIPELTTEIWELFLKQEKPWRFPDDTA